MTFSGNPDTELRHHLSIETPEEKIGRLEAEVQRLKERALIEKRNALRAKKALDAHLQMCEVQP